MHLFGDILEDWKNAGVRVPNGLVEWGAKLTPDEAWRTCQRVDWMLLWLTRTPGATSKEPLMRLARSWALRALEATGNGGKWTTEMLAAHCAQASFFYACGIPSCTRDAAVAAHDAATLAAAAIDMATWQDGVAQSVMADELRAVVSCPGVWLLYTKKAKR